MDKTTYSEHLLSRKIEIDVYMEKRNMKAARCVCLNDTRVAGAKPFVTERLPHLRKSTTIGNVLKAFTIDELFSELRRRDAI